MKTQKDKETRGRPARPLSFKFEKNRPFTVTDVFNRYKNRNPITRVAIMQRLKKMVAAGVAKIVGVKESEGRGRPMTLFKLLRA